jgi:glycosyltransferase involved in cell wall biosynthesis
MRILVVYDSISPHAGGAQEAALRWIRNAVDLGVEIKLICDQGIFNVPPANVIVAKSLDSKFLPGGRTSPFLLTTSLKRQILEFDPDLIHIHEQLFLSPQILRFAKKHGIPVLNSFHGNSHKFKSYTFPYSLFVKEGGVVNRFLKKCQSYMLQNADALTAPTEHYCQQLRKETHKDCFLLPYPIAHRFFVQSPSKTEKVTRLISVSRLAGEKNIHVVVEMMKYLKDSCTLTIVGDGLDRSYLEQQAKKLGVENSIRFMGWLKNTELPAFLAQHDLFLSPSDFETFGITYIEALATHLPCVVYDYPVAREVIPHEAAVFVDSLDPKKWATAVQELQKKPQKFTKMKKYIHDNYNQIDGYEELRSTKKLIEMYTTFLKKFPHPSHHSAPHLR